VIGEPSAHLSVISPAASFSEYFWPAENAIAPPGAGLDHHDVFAVQAPRFSLRHPGI